MITQKYQDVILVTKGFTVLNLTMVFLTIAAAELHAYVFKTTPDITLILLASVGAYMLCILYLYFQTRVMPVLAFNRNHIMYLLCGLLLMWLYHKVSYNLPFGRNGFAIDLTKYDKIYSCLNLLCAVVVAPVAEEVIYRGYFVRQLLSRGTSRAIIISSMFFVVSHLFSYSHGLNWVTVLNAIYFFLFSMIAGIIYQQTGLLAAVLFHICNNFYVLVLK